MIPCGVVGGFQPVKYTAAIFTPQVTASQTNRSPLIFLLPENLKSQTQRRKLQNEELHNLYTSPSAVKVNYSKVCDQADVLVGIFCGRTPLRRLRSSIWWNTSYEYRLWRCEMEWNYSEWTLWLAFTVAIMNLQVPLTTRKFLNFG